MSDLSSFRAIIDLWPSQPAMAADIGAGPSTVAKWRQRDVIPADWWAAILATDVASKNLLTAEALTVLAAREHDEARA